MQGILVQINQSPRGVPKHPIPTGMLSRSGLVGDRQDHPEQDNEPDQHVLLLAAESVEALRSVGYPVYWGALGETLTTRGLAPQEWRSGQRFQVGAAVIELTKPREPCGALLSYGEHILHDLYDREVHAGNPESARWGQSGFYARVLKEGLINPGDLIQLLDDHFTKASGFPGSASPSEAEQPIGPG